MVYVHYTYNQKIGFEWDENKDKANRKKHGISFDEARTVFYDENAIEAHDPDHSSDEDRFLMLGVSRRLRLVWVSYCFRKDDSVVRIISARKAAQNEIRQYHEVIL